MGASIDELTGETVELLQQLIRNRCVNEAVVDSGEEERSARLLRDELDGLGLDVETVEIEPATPTSCPSTPTGGATTRSAVS